METFMRKHFPVEINVYQAAWKLYQSFGGNIKPWRLAGFIRAAAIILIANKLLSLLPLI